MDDKNAPRSGLWWKIIIVIGLVVAVTAIIILKPRNVPPASSGLSTNVSNTDNPLEQAFKTGRVVLADFGRGICIPCKMMQPILEELAETYKGRAEILILDVNAEWEAAEKYDVKIIPTQIFFDKTGQEVWRHEGFLEKDKIIAKLVELGVK